ncbi:hypothetical protein SHIRM173S_13392 [Streptomyces hirsutus]
MGGDRGELVDPAAEKLLAPTGWVRPAPDTYPFDGDWAERYLQPLADVLGDRVRLGARVTGVSRAGRDRIPLRRGRERAGRRRVLRRTGPRLGAARPRSGRGAGAGAGLSAFTAPRPAGVVLGCCR